MIAALDAGHPPAPLRIATLQSLLHMFANRLGLGRRREYQAIFVLDALQRAEAHRKLETADV